jgi:flagellar biosynthesis/type III secretory pathway chaperone
MTLMKRETGTADFDVDRLIARLTEQREMYRQLTSLSERQRCLIAEGETEQLLAVLGERQRLIDRLTRLGRELKPLQQQWAELRPRMNARQGEQVDGLLGEVNQLLRSIIAHDQADADALAARKQSAGQAMSGLKQRRSAGAAYAAAAAGGTGGQPRVEFTGE